MLISEVAHLNSSVSWRFAVTSISFSNGGDKGWSKCRPPAQVR